MEFLHQQAIKDAGIPINSYPAKIKHEISTFNKNYKKASSSDEGLTDTAINSLNIHSKAIANLVARHTEKINAEANAEQEKINAAKAQEEEEKKRQEAAKAAEEHAEEEAKKAAQAAAEEEKKKKQEAALASLNLPHVKYLNDNNRNISEFSPEAQKKHKTFKMQYGRFKSKPSDKMKASVEKISNDIFALITDAPTGNQEEQQPQNPQPSVEQKQAETTPSGSQEAPQGEKKEKKGFWASIGLGFLD